MRDTYETIKTIKGIQENENGLEVDTNNAALVEALVRQTLDCAYFIRDYAQRKASCEASHLAPSIFAQCTHRAEFSTKLRI